MAADLPRRLLAEFVDTAFLLAIVIGSGIMATRLTSDVGLQLLVNALATGAGLVALILALGPVSGAHFNPAVTLADTWFASSRPRGTRWPEAGWYCLAQVLGACVGVMVANLMFGLSAINVSDHTRTGADLWLGEVVATVGLLLVIFGVVRSGRATAAPFAVGGYIAAAYFFTSSTSFANPAVTLARTLSNTFAGIAPASAPAFIAAQLVGMVLAVGLVALLYPGIEAVADDVLLHHDPTSREGVSRHG